MTELTIERRLADVVTETPGAARVLEAFGLDFPAVVAMEQRWPTPAS